MKELSSDIVALTMEISRIMRRSMAQSGKDGCAANLMHLHALMYLKEKRGAAMKEFAGYMSVSPSTATALTDRLVREKLVKRVQDETNRKRILLSVTPKGEKELVQSILSRKKALAKMFSVLSKQDTQELRRIFSVILQAAKD